MISGPQFDDSAGDGEHPIARVVRIFHDEAARCSSIFLDDGFSVDMAFAAPELDELSVGSIVDAARRAELELAAQRKKVAKLIFAWLNRRAYASGRLRDRLLDKGFVAASIDPVLKSFADQALLDDAEFARMYIRDQLRSRPVGPMWLRNALRKQGVPASHGEAALAEIMTPERELEEARRAALRKGDEVDRAKLQRFLRSRGFRAGVVASVAREQSERRSKFDGSRSDGFHEF